MQRTNVQVVGAAAALATVTMWLLGYFAPELMDTAPTGLEAAATALFSVGAGMLFSENTVIVDNLSPPTKDK
jgi:hypothetical protein